MCFLLANEYEGFVANKKKEKKKRRFQRYLTRNSWLKLEVILNQTFTGLCVPPSSQGHVCLFGVEDKYATSVALSAL